MAQTTAARAVVDRVKGEFLEMPGLRLTTAQAQRLWGLARTECEDLLDLLVHQDFLLRTRDGAFVMRRNLAA